VVRETSPALVALLRTPCDVPEVIDQERFALLAVVMPSKRFAPLPV